MFHRRIRVSQRIDGVLDVEKDLGYHADVDDCFKESENRSQPATALNDRRCAKGVECQIRDSRKHYQDK